MAITEREQRGLAIAALCRLNGQNGVWRVPSQSGNGKYEVYHRNGEWFFHELNNPSNRFQLSDEMVGDSGKYLIANTEVEIRWFDEEPIQVKIPVKVELKVTEAPPNTRGNTAQGGNKVVTLETGATLTVPMFVEAGDVVRINTESGDYVERI